MNEIDVIRTNHLVDPHMHIWGWEVPVYLFLGGLAAGVMIATALLNLSRPANERSAALRWLPFAAPVALSLGMGALFLDLEHKAYVWRFYLALKLSSPMSWGAWILLAIYPATLLLGLLSLQDRDLERLQRWLPGPLNGWTRSLRTWAVARERTIRRLNVGLGIALGVYTGVLLGAMGARAPWNSALLGPLFLTSGASAGAAFLLLFPLGEHERQELSKWDRLAILVEVALIALYLVGLLNGSAQAQAGAQLLLGGSYTAQFWSLVVVAGLAVPWFLEFFEARKHIRPTLAAPALVLMGGLALRWILVAAGQA